MRCGQLSHHVKLSEQFQQRWLRAICRIKWQDKVSNVEVLERCGVPSVESQAIKVQLHWTRHVIRMEGSRIPKVAFYGQLRSGNRSGRRPRLRYKDKLEGTWSPLKQALKNTCSGATPAVKGFLTLRDRTVHTSVKRARRKALPVAFDAIYMCGDCGRVYCSTIGLLSHKHMTCGRVIGKLRHRLSTWDSISIYVYRLIVM